MHDKAVYDKENRKRHFWKWWVQIAFFAAFAIFINPMVAFVMVTTYWIMFDLGYNLVVVKRDPFYVGTVAFSDRMFRSVFGKYAGQAMLFVKAGLVIISVIWLNK